MSNVCNNILRIIGNRTKIAMLPQWEEVGFFDHLPKHERNYLFDPIANY